MARNVVLSFAAVLFASTALAGKIEVIYTEIAGDPSAVVPGAKDSAGSPVFTEWFAIEDLGIAHSEPHTPWIVKGRTTQGATNDSILVKGYGLAGAAFAQDDQPLLGGVAGEKYDFFDTPTPAAWNENGYIAFGVRAKGGVAAVFEKVVVFNPNTNTHTIVHQMGDAALGLTDEPPNPSGDEIFGNSINSIHLLNDNVTVGFVNTPITNCSTLRYPAFFKGNTKFKQSRTDQIAGVNWDNFGLSDSYTTPDDAHWFSEGDDEGAGTTDLVLAVDNAVVLREGSAVAGGTPILADIFFTQMNVNGDWISRGDESLPVNDNDWCVINGVLVAKTGDPVTPAAPENWGAIFSGAYINNNGDWLLCGNTNNADPNIDNVMVINGSRILAREGDAIDLNNDGTFSDNVFLASFQPNDSRLTDDLIVYFLVTLRNGAGTSLGDAYLRLCVFDPCDTNCDGSINPFDIQPFLDVLGGSAACSGCAGDTDRNGTVNPFDINGFLNCLL